MNINGLARNATQKYLKPQIRPMITKEVVKTKNGWETEIITLRQNDQETILRKGFFSHIFDYYFTRYDYRELVRSRFNKLMRKGQLGHRSLVALINKIYSFLGSKSYKYKNYKFENDAHEIYVLLKDKNLKSRHFKKILKFLNSFYL